MKITDTLMRFEESGTKVYIPKERYSIDLSLTENPLKFSPLVMQAIKASQDTINHYPDPYHKHDATVVDGKYFRRLGKDYVRIAPQLHDTNEKFVKIIKNLLEDTSQ